MKKHVLLVLLCLPVCVMAGGNAPLDSLLRVMDSELERAGEYFRIREERIGAMKEELARPETDAEQRSALLKDLFTAYKPYQADSAVFYLQKRFEWAYSRGDNRLMDECRLLQVDYYASIGLFQEAMTVVSLLDTARLTGDQYADYLEAEARLLGEMSSYSQDRYFAGEHMKRCNAVYERLLSRLDHSSPRYLRILEGVLWYHTPDKAMEINNRLLRGCAEGGQEYALCCFMRAMEYDRKHDTDNARVWYAKSAIADLRAGIRDNGSSWKLAHLMSEMNDVDRAYRYARYSMENALFYHARIRQAQVANSWSIIERQYQTVMEERHRHMRSTLIAVSALALAAVAALVVVVIQRRRIAGIQRELRDACERLKRSNVSLASKNANLNQQNVSLAEANRAKEENIGYMLTLCSGYIDKLDKYRKSVAKRVGAGKYAEVLAETRDPEFMQAELDEFYRDFDTKFLSICPDFVERFNELLVEEERITLKNGELLTPELRIFALIRLGIDNSSRIAELLRYSVNTIYNYRAKVKNKALGDREHFEDRVKRIGLA